MSSRPCPWRAAGSPSASPSTASRRTSSRRRSRSSRSWASRSTSTPGSARTSPLKNSSKDYDAVFIGCGTILSQQARHPRRGDAGRHPRRRLPQADQPGREGLPGRPGRRHRRRERGHGRRPDGRPHRVQRMSSSSTAAPGRRCRPHPRRSKRPSKKGIKMEFLVAPKRVVGKDGKVTGIECIRMELGEPDASGRRRPVPIKGPNSSIACDAIVPAIGQEADLCFHPEGERYRHQQVEQLRRRSGHLRDERPGRLRRRRRRHRPRRPSSRPSLPGRRRPSPSTDTSRAKILRRAGRRTGRRTSPTRPTSRKVAKVPRVSYPLLEAGRAERRFPGGGAGSQRRGGRPGGEPLPRLRHLLRVLPVRRRLHRRGDRP